MREQQCVSPQWCWQARITSGWQLGSCLSLWLRHVGDWSGCWNTWLYWMMDSRLTAKLFCTVGIQYSQGWDSPKNYTWQCWRSATAPATTRFLDLWPTRWSMSHRSLSSSGAKMREQQCVSPQWCWQARITSGWQLGSCLSLWLRHVGDCYSCWNTWQSWHHVSMDSRLSAKLSKIYYSPQGYSKGLTDKHLASAAKVPEDVAKDWLKKQAIWQIYLPAPRHIPRPKFDVRVPNEVHQADLLFLPHDRVGRKTYKYALTVVDVASRYKEAQPLTSKGAAEVADALSRIYTRGPLKWPKLLQVDPGREFMGATGQLLAKHGVSVRRGRVDIHRDQGIVERFNRTRAERLFGHQQAQELLLRSEGSGERSREWVKRLPAVIAALNGEVTRLTGKRPRDAIRVRTRSAVAQTHSVSSSVTPGRPVGLKEQKLRSDVLVRYLYQPGELEGGQRRRATDAVWSLQAYRLARAVAKSGAPVVYYLIDGPLRGFVREELLVVPSDTQQPPRRLLLRNVPWHVVS